MANNRNIINVCETWLHDNIDDNEISVNGYGVVRSDRGHNQDGSIRRGGGVCTYIKQGINFEEQHELYCSNADIEMMVIKLMLPFTRDIYILNVYRPPSGDVDNFVNILQNVITSIRRDNTNELIGGDMNIDLLRPNSINARKILKFIKINQLKQLINTLTRPDSNTCLDLNN